MFHRHLMSVIGPNVYILSSIFCHHLHFYISNDSLFFNVFIPRKMMRDWNTLK